MKNPEALHTQLVTAVVVAATQTVEEEVEHSVSVAEEVEQNYNLQVEVSLQIQAA